MRINLIIVLMELVGPSSLWRRTPIKSARLLILLVMFFNVATCSSRPEGYPDKVRVFDIIQPIARSYPQSFIVAETCAPSMLADISEIDNDVLTTSGDYVAIGNEYRFLIPSSSTISDIASVNQYTGTTFTIVYRYSFDNSTQTVVFVKSPLLPIDPIHNMGAAIPEFLSRPRTAEEVVAKLKSLQISNLPLKDNSFNPLKQPKRIVWTPECCPERSVRAMVGSLWVITGTNQEILSVRSMFNPLERQRLLEETTPTIGSLMRSYPRSYIADW